MFSVKVAFPTDEHYPYQDEEARSVALQIVADFQPHVRITGSDGLDWYQISKFNKRPDRVLHLQDDINLWKAGQRDWISAAPGAKAYYIVSNHDDRLRNYVWQHPELYGLDAVRLYNILGFGELGIIFNKDGPEETANRELTLFNKLVIKHGSVARKWSAYSARAELEREAASISVLSGHTHRGGTHYVRTRTGVVTGQEGFCLCGTDPEYCQRPDWQQGITLATVSKDALSIEAIPFYRKGNKVAGIWRGKEYRS